LSGWDGAAFIAVLVEADDVDEDPAALMAITLNV
jgi:hypothetical protein